MTTLQLQFDSLDGENLFQALTFAADLMRRSHHIQNSLILARLAVQIDDAMKAHAVPQLERLVREIAQLDTAGQRDFFRAG